MSENYGDLARQRSDGLLERDVSPDHILKFLLAIVDLLNEVEAAVSFLRNSDIVPIVRFGQRRIALTHRGSEGTLVVLLRWWGEVLPWKIGLVSGPKCWPASDSLNSGPPVLR